MLRDLHLESYYRSDRHNLLNDFYIPCLEQTMVYRRAVGYFTSDSLAAAAQGLSRLIVRNGVVQLVASPVLSKEDIEAIKLGYTQKESVIAEAVERSFDLSNLSEVKRKRLEFLAWLISQGRLEIRIALVESAVGQFGIYHEKIGIFSDDAGNDVVFTGSANESIGGLVSNFESIDVYRSWESSEKSRTIQKIYDFERLWKNLTPNLKIYPFPDAVREQLLRIRPDHEPTLEPDETNVCEAKDIGTPLIPPEIKIRDYQQKAIKLWFENKGRGLWKMATGTGKTISALALIANLFAIHRRGNKALFVVIICPYKHLVTQWVNEAKKFGVFPIKCFESKASWANLLAEQITSCNEGHLQFLCALVTNATFGSETFQTLLATVKVPFLVVGDEAHNLGAHDLRTALPQNANYRLGLSATPERWFDDEGTSAILDYFGPVVYELPLEDAIRMGALCRYDYYPHIVELEEDEIEQYLELTSQIAQAANASNSELTEETDNPKLKWLLIQRARLLAVARGKLAALENAIDPTSSHNLIYCGDGRVQQDLASEEVRQIQAVTVMLGQKLGMSVHSYTAETYLEERDELRTRFASGQLQDIVAIRCLDEGVDIPETRRAYILASSTNPRQFIQRRGRILRRAPGKEMAEVHDFLVIPPQREASEELFSIERRLFRRELQRVNTFAKLADNGPQALNVLLPLREKYQLLDVG